MPLTIYDQAGRYAAKLAPKALLSWWLKIPQERIRFRTWLDTRGIVFPGEPNRVNDTVAWLADDDPAVEWALALEFSLVPDGSMFGRVLVYLGSLWIEKRPTDAGKERFCVGAIVVNLTGEGNASRHMRYPGTEVETNLRVAECNLATWDANATLAQIALGELSPAVLPWIPLLRGAEEASVREEWKRLASQEPDERLRSDYGALAAVFSEASGRSAEWKESLKEWNMIQSPQVLEWMAQGEAKGEAKGEARGKVEGEQNLLLRVLQKRYGTIPADLMTLVRSTPNLDSIHSWLDLALDTASLNEFRRKAGI